MTYSMSVPVTEKENKLLMSVPVTLVEKIKIA